MPDIVLQSLWQPLSMAMPIDSHDMTRLDYITYQMIASLRADDVVTGMCRMILRDHPVWPVATFLPTSDHEGVCKLVCDMVDPRWYFNVARPNRDSKLMRYFGLTPALFPGLAKLGAKPIEARMRAAAAVRAWAGDYTMNDVKCSDPRNFLWRRAASNAKNGYMSATRQFVRLIAGVWKQAVAPPGRRVFRIEQMLRPEEAHAFREHLQATTRRGSI
jgi:hypothetical protein